MRAYRGPEEALQAAEVLLLDGRFAEAYWAYRHDILAVAPDPAFEVGADYAGRLVAEPNSIAALTGSSFARWVLGDYADAIDLIDRLLAAEPDNVYGYAFRGSSRVLADIERARGIDDLDRALQLDPNSPDVRFVVADAYCYGIRDLTRALAEASLALKGGLDTPRVHAILASAALSSGDAREAAVHFGRHIDLVTTDVLTAPSLEPGRSVSLNLVPGRAYDVPLAAVAGHTIAVATTSRDVTDSIAVLLAPDGSPVTGGDDEQGPFAAVDWRAADTGTHRLRVTSFEAVETGTLDVTRA